MQRIILLTDYKNHFGSKWDSNPYNSGFDKKLLVDLFRSFGLEAEVLSLCRAKEIKSVQGVPVLYTSSEDIGYHYKDFIEDIIYYLELKGAIIIPAYKYLRANNNKVFMELIRDQVGYKWDNKLISWCYGTYEEMRNDIDSFDYPIVIKTPRGALSRGVSLANNQTELIEKVKNISRSKHFLMDLKDKLRPYKHKGYKINSLYREKFILQSFIPKLTNDWKILIFGTKYFVLTRHVKKGDFRASGSHNNYMAGSSAILPDGLLDFAEKVYSGLGVPHLSIDVVYDELSFHLIEFQALYFGTSTINMSDVYFEKEGANWKSIKLTESVECLYVYGIVKYLNNND